MTLNEAQPWHVAFVPPQFMRQGRIEAIDVVQRFDNDEMRAKLSGRGGRDRWVRLERRVEKARSQDERDLRMTTSGLGSIDEAPEKGDGPV